MGVVNEQSNTYMVYIGIDIGQSQDPTAIVVADPEIRENEIHYVIRFLRRLPLGISYPAIIEEVIKVHQNIPEPDGSFELNKQVWIDATGVGKPVVDLIRNNCSYINLHEVFITGGEAKDNINPWSRVIKLPKAYLVSRLQVMLGYGRNQEIVQGHTATFPAVCRWETLLPRQGGGRTVEAFDDKFFD